MRARLAVRRTVRHRLGAGGGKVLSRCSARREEAAAAGASRIEGDELRYHEHRFPLAPGSGEPAMTAERPRPAALRARRLAPCRRRPELPAVLRREHPGRHPGRGARGVRGVAREIVRWVRDGLVDGLRVDHPDGLADPGGYLDALAAATGGAYVLVEKILEGGERCRRTGRPPAPPATTHSPTSTACSSIRRARPARCPRYGGCAATAGAAVGRRSSTTRSAAIADGILHSEVRRLGRELRAAGVTVPHQADADVDDAIAELLACFPVYRSYLPFGAEHLRCRRADASTPPRTRRGHRARCSPCWPTGPSGRDPLPADVGHGHGQGRRGHAPSTASTGWRRLTEVGGRPRRVRDHRRRVPRAPAAAPGRAIRLA